MAAPMREKFRVAVERVLNSWTVLKLAVSHGFGGAESEDKAVWMITAIDQWFTENSNIETFELEDFLENVMDSEFDTIADDGSLSEISRLICGYYRLCQTGEDEKLKEQLDKLPPVNVQACQQSVVANNTQALDEDEEEEGIDPNRPPPLPAQQQQTDSMKTDEPEDDGWTTVGKKHKNR